MENNDKSSNSSNKNNNITYEVLPENSAFDLDFKLTIIGVCSIGKSCLTKKQH